LVKYWARKEGLSTPVVSALITAESIPEVSPEWLERTNRELEGAYAKLNEGLKSALWHAGRWKESMYLKSFGTLFGTL
jgi:hypothetical protein